jgi:hypothetical protein
METTADAKPITLDDNQDMTMIDGALHAPSTLDIPAQVNGNTDPAYMDDYARFLAETDDNVLNINGQIEEIPTISYAGKAVKACKIRARGQLDGDFLTFNLAVFVSFMLYHDKFASKGIFITDENKEESYIKIIEQGDDNLISDLEKYINLRDEVKKIEEIKNRYINVINQLKNLSDYDDKDVVNQIVESYLRN